jgi:hypothetical protein
MVIVVSYTPSMVLEVFQKLSPGYVLSMEVLICSMLKLMTSLLMQMAKSLESRVVITLPLLH